MKARLVHGVEAKGWKMRFCMVSAEVELETREPATYIELERRFRAAKVNVKPLRRDFQ